MLRGLFVTGTDTGVGKTIVSAALMHRCRATTPVRYWKPIQTGIEQDDDTAVVRELGGCSAEEILDQGIRLPRPVSPHLAAQLAGTAIALDPLMRLARERSDGRFWIIEGAGGVMVPINDDHLMLDLIALLGVATVVVARTALGTINHTLLTLAALRARVIPIAGVVMVGPRDDHNRSAIETYGRVPVLGEIPPLTELTLETVAAAARSLDPGFLS